MYSFLGPLNGIIGSSLCFDLVGQNANLGTFLTIDVNFFFLYYSLVTLTHRTKLFQHTETL